MAGNDNARCILSVTNLKCVLLLQYIVFKYLLCVFNLKSNIFLIIFSIIASFHTALHVSMTY